tara:strand:- start:24 stop:224 length:201 start_codon:yes stop_codon:yes gene_type:complete
MKEYAINDFSKLFVEIIKQNNNINVFIVGLIAQIAVAAVMTAIYRGLKVNIWSIKFTLLLIYIFII